MAFVLTQQDRRRSAVRDLSIKMSIEVPFERELRPLLKRMAEDYASSIANRGLWGKQAYRDDLLKILNKYYDKTQKAFQSDTRSTGKKHGYFLLETKNEDEINAFVEEEMTPFKELTATNAAAAILNTTNKNFEESTFRAEQSIAEEGRIATDAEVASIILANEVVKQQNRASGIAATEVQGIAEATKQAEALGIQSLSQQDGADATSNRFGNQIAVSPKDLKKQWNAILDSKTRPDHVSVDGTKKNIDEDFIVGGYPMNRPGDRRFAPPEQYMNCRCTLDFTV